MALPSGLAAQWVAQDETVYGTVPTWSSPPSTIFDSDTVKLVKTPKEGTGIYAGALVAKSARRVITEYAVQGGLPGELPAQGLNRWLFRMFGSFGQSAATLTQDGTTGAYSATHIPGDLTGHSFALQAGRPDTGGTVTPYTYVGCKVSEWEISATIGEIVKWTMTIEGRNELATGYVSSADGLNAAVPSLQTYTAPPGGVFKWNQGALFYGGTPNTVAGVTSLTSPTQAGLLKSFSLKFTRPLDLTRYSPEKLGYRNEPLQNGLVKITGQFVVEYLSSTAYYSAFANDTATSLNLVFTGPAIGTGTDHSQMGLLMSNLRLEDGTPPNTGPAVLTQTIPISVYDDGVNNTLQATYWTLDTV